MSHLLSEHEWIQCILQAASQSRTDETLVLLRQCLLQHPACGAAHYLLATELAQTGDFTVAQTHFAAALRVDPLSHEARLQWALLCLMRDQANEALAVLEGFDPLSLPAALDAFQRGLRGMARGRLEEAVQHLRAGLAQPHANGPLAQDMQALARHLEQHMPCEVDGAATLPVSSPHFLVRAYVGE